MGEASMNYIALILELVGGLAAIAALYVIHFAETSFVEQAAQDYDYVIVGGGTAGCVLARRLAEDSRRYSILLLEAGNKPPLWSWVPAATPKLQRTIYDWSYRAEPQKEASWGHHDNVGNFPRGKMLGGSHQMNYMLHMTGSPGDYKEWQKMGLEEWGYDTINRQLKSNTCIDTEECTSEKCPICVKSSEESVLKDAFLEGANSIGLKTTDLNSNSEVGIMSVLTTIYGRWKWTILDGYLQQVVRNKNLNILLKSKVTRVAVINGRARGVEYQMEGSEDVSRVRAKKEVILAAGAIETPVILQNSGIGPGELLERLEIPIVADLPVGIGLQDHMNFPLYFHVQAPITNNLAKTMSFGSVLNYLWNGSGPIGNSNVIAVGRAPMEWQNMSSSQPQELKAELGLIGFNFGSVEPDLSTWMTNMRLETHEDLFPSCRNTSKEGFLIMNTCLHPKSRGKVELTEDGRTLIDPNYFSDPFDIQCAINALKLAAAIGESKPLQKYGVKLHLPRLRECSKYRSSLNNNKYLECIIKTAAFTGYHPTSTCRMGPEGDPDRVTDSDLRVVGIRSLRVVDASVLPTQISGTPNSVVISIAERAATLILKDSKTF